MTLTPVESLPKRTTQSKNAVEKVLKEFVSSGVTIARIDYHAGEYKDCSTLYSVAHMTIKRLELPIRVCQRNLQVYLIRI